ncbi:MAG: class I SAM-dependent methyltransferase [Polyangiales bacterium]
MTVQIHPRFGVVAPERGWVPSPRYLLRRARILEHARHWPKGRVLELGCGAGALVYELTHDGFECTAVEHSPAAAALATEINDGNAEIRTEAAEWDAAFDYVLAFEVLEHIEDDRTALIRWRQWLRPGGLMVLSVPAHPQRWNATDEWAGHVRRYEREQLRDVLEGAGMEVEEIECYGFPLANLLERVRAAQCARQLSGEEHQDREARTAQSGVDRTTETRLFPLYAGPVGSGMIRMFSATQKLFLQTDFGNGLIALARRR